MFLNLGLSIVFIYLNMAFEVFLIERPSSFRGENHSN
jgi:hypothetical protein